MIQKEKIIKALQSGPLGKSSFAYLDEDDENGPFHHCSLGRLGLCAGMSVDRLLFIESHVGIDQIDEWRAARKEFDRLLLRKYGITEEIAERIVDVNDGATDANRLDRVTSLIEGLTDESGGAILAHGNDAEEAPEAQEEEVAQPVQADAQASPLSGVTLPASAPSDDAGRPLQGGGHWPPYAIQVGEGPDAPRVGQAAPELDLALAVVE